MKKTLLVFLAAIILFLAAYGAYALTKNLISYIKFHKQYSSITYVEKIKNGTTPLPDFYFVSPDGEKIHLSSVLKNHDFVILSFGSIYCGNCHNEYKTIEKEHLLDKIPQNAAFYFVVPEGRDFIAQFEKDLNIHLPLYVLQDGIMKKLGISKIPAYMLIGKDRKVRIYIEGFKESTLLDLFNYAKTHGSE
jgi:peroxiredoxin